jgi:hypothetical protein
LARRADPAEEEYRGVSVLRVAVFPSELEWPRIRAYRAG